MSDPVTKTCRCGAAFETQIASQELCGSCLVRPSRSFSKRDHIRRKSKTCTKVLSDGSVCGRSFVPVGSHQIHCPVHMAQASRAKAPVPGGAEGVKNDKGKTRWDLFPFSAASKIVDVLEYGATKYGRDNWKTVKDAERRYFAACLRHLASWIEGEKLDPESHLQHLAHAACSLLFILHKEKI